MVSVYTLSGFTKFNSDLELRWGLFQQQRSARLIQEARYGSAPEKVAEDILKDLFTIVLDWPLGNINNQVKYADMVLTHQGIKKLIVEVKRPNSISWDKISLVRAMQQAYRYAQEQRVATIAVSDGNIFQAVDIKNGGLANRLRIELSSSTASPELYWVSVDGIYRPVEHLSAPELITNQGTTVILKADNYDESEEILHSKYKVPARCFGYVGNPLKQSTWKLPCRLNNGRPDEGRLPGAIRAVLTNYRGAHNKSIPEDAIPDVLVRLGRAAWEAGKMPGQITNPPESYKILHDALYQLDRLDEIKAQQV